MKRLSALFLAAVALISLCACQAEGEEIARAGFIIDGNTVIGEGFNSLKQFLGGVFGDPDDVIEMAGSNVEAIVEFDDAVYLQFGDVCFPTRMLYYTLSMLKSTEINESLTYYINAEDTDEYWNSLVYDLCKTRKEVLLEQAIKFMTNTVITMGIMNEYAFSESGGYIDSYQNVLALYGSEQAIEDYYGAYGLTADLFKQFLRYSGAYNEFKEYMISGPLFPDEDAAKKYFYEKCTYLEQIYISYTFVNDDGYIVYKTDEEIKEAKARAEQLYAEIQAKPEMFDRRMNLTEHSLWTQNPTGYCYVPGEIMPEIEELYFSLEDGEVGAVETPIGYYIIRPKEKTDEVYEGNNSIIKESLRLELYQQEIDRYRDKLTVNNDQLTRYAFSDILLLR